MLGDVVEYMSSELRVGRLLVLIGRACPVSSCKKLRSSSLLEFAGFGDAHSSFRRAEVRTLKDPTKVATPTRPTAKSSERFVGKNMGSEWSFCKNWEMYRYRLFCSSYHYAAIPLKWKFVSNKTRYIAIWTCFQRLKSILSRYNHILKRIFHKMPYPKLSTKMDCGLIDAGSVFQVPSIDCSVMAGWQLESFPQLLSWSTNLVYMKV